MKPAAESSERDANVHGAPADITPDAVRAELEKILASPGFVNADRLSRFLRYAVEEALKGQPDKLKESLLGIEVFGRKPTYDPRVDAVVRTEAVKLRARLREYYESEGREDDPIIDLPKGGYVPAFRWREKEAPAMEAPAMAAIAEALPDHGHAAWWKPAIIGGLLLALAVGASLFALRSHSRSVDARTPGLSSIAVLPFADLSPDRDQEYFCDGMTEEIIDALTKVGGFRVVARTSSFAFKGTQQDVREIGKKLNVGAVLEGSVRKDGNLLRVTAQLNSVADGYHLWSETYERELKDVFTVQDEISRSIVNTLQVRLAGAPRALRSTTENLAAYDLYLQGRYHWRHWRTEGAEKAIQFFEQAVAKDPRYAAAYAGLADSYCWLGFFGALPPNEAMPKARQFAHKALALDDSLAEAHTSLGYVKTLYEFDWAGAKREFSRAIQLNPDSSEAHFGYGITYLCPLGKTAEGLAEMKLAKDQDPLSPVTNTYLGLAYMFDGQREAGIEQFKRALSLEPNFAEAHLGLASCYLDQRNFDAFYAELEKARGQAPDWRVDLSRGLGYAAQGKKADALSVIRKWERPAGGAYVRPTSIAIVYAALGDRENVLTWLDKAYSERDGMLAFLKNEHIFAPYESDPRFLAMFAKIGLPR